MGNKALILGTFDGVHSGHLALLNKGVALKREGFAPVVVLFTVHPGVILGKEVHILTTNQEREVLLRRYGVDYSYMDFTAELASKTPEEYLDLLCKRYSPAAMIVGRNHTFGAKGAGTPKTILHFATKYGYKFFMEASVLQAGEPVSSTRIRRYIMDGDIDTANSMLGYRYGFDGIVENGRKVGRSMGFPTANVSFPQEKVCPANGVYAVTVRVKGKRYGAVMNVGNRPTFENTGGKTYECYLLGYNGDLYGNSVRVEMLKRMRPEIAFASKDLLQQQITNDAFIALSYFKGLKENILL